jgi:hypothetical protein
VPDASPAHAGPKPQARSRISNGQALLPGIDGRSTWVRRLRDLIALHTADMGGQEAISAAEASIIRRAACLTVELERLELDFAPQASSCLQSWTSISVVPTLCVDCWRPLACSAARKTSPQQLNPLPSAWPKTNEAKEEAPHPDRHGDELAATIRAILPG